MMRTAEEVRATLETAKLKQEELMTTVHCLSFSEYITSGDYCLLELDDVLCKHIESGKRLVIRGDKDEHTVLCSDDKTYDVKIADTSNLLIIIPDCKTPDQLSDDPSTQTLVHAQIYGLASNYWELRKCRPKIKKLKNLLLENPYEGPDSDKEKASEGLKYTIEDLMNRIQASEQELMDHLHAVHACKIEGYWRILDFDYEMKLLNHITQLVDSESWSFSKVPLKVCLEELGILEPKEMIEHCLNCYGDRYTDEAGEIYFALNEDKVCRAIAQMLLQNVVRFNLSEFQEVWQQSVPEGMTTRQDQLKGLALVDLSSRPETIFLLKVEDLPEDTVERFTNLFTLRQKWTEADISPYIQRFICPKAKQTPGMEVLIGVVPAIIALPSLSRHLKQFEHKYEKEASTMGHLFVQVKAEVALSSMRTNRLTGVRPAFGVAVRQS